MDITTGLSVTSREGQQHQEHPASRRNGACASCQQCACVSLVFSLRSDVWRLTLFIKQESESELGTRVHIILLTTW